MPINGGKYQEMKSMGFFPNFIYFSYQEVDVIEHLCVRKEAKRSSEEDDRYCQQ